jgi:hypothetical protein
MLTDSQMPLRSGTDWWPVWADSQKAGWIRDFSDDALLRFTAGAN